ncbi:uncharacterized protein FOMMEDRAFT_95194 [Fomitiporia mediterranea MF3/22]|uniref:uncharacterized protein n=1 Tax=Fomitiporia mediterranea (strain MF3/22) TaxID=694068 RepID=UPI0004408263|nr:uncharacterized protein FOMMEDRAFT_95194 [Fomitiporia mediterranea MF3/22]EJC98905.1 hypothetical protein FOMMEDRAFT_95194 [Fomitiporia mediterranea MF3/22]
MPFGAQGTTGNAGQGATGPRGAERRHSAPARPRERKEWTVPPPPGLTLRERIEKREREAGLRCDEVSCSLAPTDDDPLPHWPEDMLEKLAVRRDGSANNEPLCAHRFHPACLVDAGRVAGWDGRGEDGVVEVSCPICRTIGHVEEEEWRAGEKACGAAFTQ